MPDSCGFFLCNCTADSNSKGNGHHLVYTDSNKANQNQAWIYLTDKRFKSTKLNHLKHQIPDNCILHVSWTASQEKTASFFIFRFSPTATIPPTVLPSPAGPHLLPHNPCWNCSTGFFLWQVHFLPSSRVEWDNYALPALCGDGFTWIPAGDRDLAQKREWMPEKHLQRKERMRQSALHSPVICPFVNWAEE